MVSKKSTKVGTIKWTGMKKSGASAKPATKKRANEIGADSKSTRVPLFSGYERVIKKSKRPIELVQETKYQGNDWWEWAVWVEAKPADMAKINYVEYKLHPTFPNPLRKQNNRDEKFRGGSAGWGEFMISAEIVNQDRSRIKTHHWLTLEYPDKSPIPSGKFSVLASKKESERPGIFLSGGVTDLGLGSALTDALQHQGF